MSDTVPLVVISQDWTADDSGSSSVVYQAKVSGGSLLLTGPTATGRFSSERQLPSERCELARVGSDGQHDEWRSVVTWIRTIVGDEALFVVDFDHPLRELVVLGAASFGIRYCLRFTTAPQRFVPPLEYAIMNNAEAMVFAERGVEDELRAHYVGPYVAVATVPELSGLAQPEPSVAPSGGGTSGIMTSGSARGARDGSVRALIVAYLSGPCRTVGVQRANYWFEELNRVSDAAIDVHMATAIGWGAPNEKLHVVPDFHAASLLNEVNAYPSWSSDFVASEQRDAESFNTLAFYWRYALEKYFDATDHQFDVVVISGNPFSCFDFAAYAKRRWHSRVILDYRDPFGNNPRFKYTPEAREKVRYAERGLNFQADVITVVNDYCIDLVEGGTDAEILTIPNGFDERVMSSIQRASLSSDKINFVHSGSFTHDRSPANIIAALDPERHVFHHVGNMAGVDPQVLDVPCVVAHGRMSYSGSLGVVGGSDIGVVFLSEQNFETTTKLYDYLAMGIDVLLCTNGQVEVGAVADLLTGQEGVFWCENSAEGVARFVQDYSPTSRRNLSSGDRFSRRYGTELLAAKILDLAGNSHFEA